jgi:hypothetical protein
LLIGWHCCGCRGLAWYCGWRHTCTKRGQLVRCLGACQACVVQALNNRWRSICAKHRLHLLELRDDLILPCNLILQARNLCRVDGGRRRLERIKISLGTVACGAGIGKPLHNRGRTVCAKHRLHLLELRDDLILSRNLILKALAFCLIRSLLVTL